MSTEKKFLHKDEKRIKDSIQMYDEWANYLQNGLNEAGKLFSKPLTKDEKLKVLKEGWSGVSELLRSKSQFPNAKVETLLELEGKDGSVAKNALNHAASRFAAVGYIVEGDTVKIDPKVIEKLEDECTYFTQNGSENKYLELATELSQVLEKCFDANIFHSLDRSQFASALNKLITIHPNKDGENKLLPNTHRIKGIKEVA